MNKDNLIQAHDFLKAHLEAHTAIDPLDIKMRYEHSLRVFHTGVLLCEQEGYDDEVLPLACLLHDIAKFDSKQEADHGRNGAKLLKPFLDTLVLTAKQKADILYCIAAHVDGNSGYDYPPLIEADALCDCDLIDHLSALRIAETMMIELMTFGGLALLETRIVQKLNEIDLLMETPPVSSETAKKMLIERLELIKAYNENLYKQVKASRFEVDIQ